MPLLPSDADLDQLSVIAEERLRAVQAGEGVARRWFDDSAESVTLSAVRSQLARDFGHHTWAELRVEVARRQLLDARDPEALAEFVERHPALASADLANWSDHPLGASPLGYLAMARYDTASGLWRDVANTGAAANLLIAAGAPVDGDAGDRETPLITAASYGDADIAAVLIAAGADIDSTASADSGGVPGGSALLHAAVFGNSEVIDVLSAAGALVGSLEEAAAVGDLGDWDLPAHPMQTRLRALIMAVDHERIDAISAFVAAGVPIDEEDEVFGRQALQLAASNGRAISVVALLSHGADPERKDSSGMTALDHCRYHRGNAENTATYDEIESALTGGGGSVLA